MKAVILAAGSSRRLRPITDTIPKSMIPVGGVPLLSRHLRHLTSAGVHEITVVVGYLKERILDFLSQEYPSVNTVENPIYDRSGSGYSLLVGVRTLRDSEPLVFMDADILYDPRILVDLPLEPERSVLYVGESACDDEAVKVTVDNRGMVSRIAKRLDRGYVVTGESIGIVRLGTGRMPVLLDLLESVAGSRGPDFEWEHVLDQHASALSMSARTTSLPWLEIDFPEDITRAESIARALPDWESSGSHQGS